MRAKRFKGEAVQYDCLTINILPHPLLFTQNRKILVKSALCNNHLGGYSDAILEIGLDPQSNDRFVGGNSGTGEP